MYCGNCGKELKEGANFCGNCGNKVKIERELKNSSKNLEYVIKENSERQENDILTETINENIKNQKHKNRIIKRTLNIVIFIFILIILYILIAKLKQNNVEPKDINNNEQEEIEKITLNVVNNLRQDIDIEINKEFFLKYIVDDLNTIGNEYLTEDTNVELFSIIGLYNVNKNEISFINYMVFYTTSDNKDCIIAVQKVKGADDILLPYIAMIDNISYTLVSNEIIQTTMSFLEVMENHTFNSDHVMFSIAPKVNSDIYELIVDDVNIDIILTENIDNSEQNIISQDILSNQNSNDNEGKVDTNEVYEEMMNSNNDSSISNSADTSSNTDLDGSINNNSSEQPVETYTAPSINIIDLQYDIFEKEIAVIEYTVADENDSQLNVVIKHNGNTIEDETQEVNKYYSRTIQLVEGTNTIQIIATNSKGKTTTETKTKQFTYTAPIINVPNGVPSTTEKETITLSYYITDNYSEGTEKNIKVTIQNNGQVIEETNVMSMNWGNEKCSIPLTGGTNKIIISAINSKGKTTTKEFDVIREVVRRRINDKMNIHIELKEKKTHKFKRFKINQNLAEEIFKFIKNMNMNDYIFKSRRGINKHITRVQVYKDIRKILSNSICSLVLNLKIL